MKLSEIYNILSDIALSQPNINQVILNDVYRLDHIKDAKYGVFCITQSYEHEETGTERIYSLNLYYIDRLLEDGSNDVDIQSTGIEVLSNIIKHFLSMCEGLAELYENIKYQTFYQKFVDETAGVYSRVKLYVPLDNLCEENYEDSDF